MKSAYRKLDERDIDPREYARGIRVASDADYSALTEAYYAKHNRMGFYRPVIDAVLDLPVEAFAKGVLEVGAYKMPFVKESVRMEVGHAHLPRTVLHDAGSAPWPFEDRRFGVCIASHVLEHLKGRQSAALREIARVSDWAVVALPHMWRKSDVNIDHENIDPGVLAGWASGLPLVPYRVWIDRVTPGYDQFVVVYKCLQPAT